MNYYADLLTSKYLVKVMSIVIFAKDNFENIICNIVQKDEDVTQSLTWLKTGVTKLV